MIAIGIVDNIINYYYYWVLLIIIISYYHYWLLLLKVWVEWAVIVLHVVF